VKTALTAGADPVVVVTGHQEGAVRAVLVGERVELVSNPRWAKGMSSSLAAGVQALEGRVEGALICLGDMPRVSVDDLRALIRAFVSGEEGPRLRNSTTPQTPERAAWPAEPPSACVPVHDGRQGNPVLWSARWFPELRALSGDRGAKSLLDEIEGSVLWVQAGAGVLFDADTPEALDLLRQQEGP
jgi:molybdenum cofactor cytidylyltransferase